MKNLRKDKSQIQKLLYKSVDGVGVVEIILILVVIVGLVVIFRNEITDIVNNTFNAIKTKANSFTI